MTGSTTHRSALLRHCVGRGRPCCSSAGFSGGVPDRRPQGLQPTPISPLASIFSLVLGIGLYGLTYIYPLYLGRIRGDDLMMIGETLFISGLVPMFMTAPRGHPVQQDGPG